MASNNRLRIADDACESSMGSNRSLPMDLAEERKKNASLREMMLGLQIKLLKAQLSLEAKDRVISQVMQERDATRTQAVDNRFGTLETAVADLASSAHAKGETALEQVNKVKKPIPKISHAGIGYGSALTFNAIRIKHNLDLRDFDIFDEEIEEQVEATVGIMKKAGKNLADVVDYGTPIRNV